MQNTKSQKTEKISLCEEAAKVYGYLTLLRQVVEEVIVDNNEMLMNLSTWCKLTEKRLNRLEGNRSEQKSSN